jgi:HSP20 family protein
MVAPGEPQRILVKVYRTPDRIMVAAAMPGLEPEDIVVEVLASGHVMLHGRQRGRHQAGATVLIDEWHPGPYQREVALPVAVDGDLANVTYSNGVLVVALPVVEQTRPARLTLEHVGPAHGERVGNVGHPPLATTTAEHRAAQAAQQAEHGGPTHDRR